MPEHIIEIVIGVAGVIGGAILTLLIQTLLRWRNALRAPPDAFEFRKRLEERLESFELRGGRELRRIQEFRDFTTSREERLDLELRKLELEVRQQGAPSGRASRAILPTGHTIRAIEDSDERSVSLLFATNRKKATHSQGWFNGERASEISYGRAAIRIPEEHRIGKIELPFRLKLLSLTLYEQEKDPKKHFTIRSLDVVSLIEWARSIEEWPSDQALIFVHGFNVSFQDGLNRLAQIVWDLKYPGVPILLSWPSRKRVPDYWYDRESALGARQAFIDVLKHVKSQQNIKQIHILAHSMGNLVVLDALANFNHQLEMASLGELIMAAPDVDRDSYASTATAVRKFTSGMTLYASSTDRALALSKRIAGNIPRAGDVPSGGPIVLPDIESIDATAVGSEIFGLNHSTFAESRSILNDVSLVIRTGQRPPHDRLVEIRGVPDGAEQPTYWRYSP